MRGILVAVLVAVLGSPVFAGVVDSRHWWVGQHVHTTNAYRSGHVVGTVRSVILDEKDKTLVLAVRVDPLRFQWRRRMCIEVSRDKLDWSLGIGVFMTTTEFEKLEAKVDCIK